MRIKRIIKNKDLKVVSQEDLDFKDFCSLMSRKILSLIYLVEDYSRGELDFNSIRRNVLNIAGEIRRLPEMIESENDKNNKDGAVS